MELRKLPPEIQTGEDIVNWMRFFNGKSREEFKNMAKTDKYLDEAYKTLKELSADDKKRIEYEEREKALKDYNTQISSAEKRGEKIGEERGQKRGEELVRKIFKMYMAQSPEEEIARECNITVERVRRFLRKFI